MAKTEKLLQRIAELERETGIRRTLFAACPNSTAVIKAAFRAAKRNNAPIYFAATLNQIDCDGGYTGMRPDEFVKLVRMEAAAVNFEGIYIVAIDHGGPWLKDKQRTEKWSTEAAMDGVKRSFEAALLAGYDLIHVDPTVDINVPAGQTIDIRLVAARTVELIRHCETFAVRRGCPKSPTRWEPRRCTAAWPTNGRSTPSSPNSKQDWRAKGSPTYGPVSSWARWEPTSTRPSSTRR